MDFLTSNVRALARRSEPERDYWVEVLGDGWSRILHEVVPDSGSEGGSSYATADDHASEGPDKSKAGGASDAGKGTATSNAGEENRASHVREAAETSNSQDDADQWSIVARDDVPLIPNRNEGQTYAPNNLTDFAKANASLPAPQSATSYASP